MARSLRPKRDSVGIISAPSDAPTLRVVALVVKRYADAAGLDPDAFAGHSLRSRFLTSADDAGAGVLRIMELSRLQRVRTFQGYVRQTNLFKGHTGAGLLGAVHGR